MGRAVALEHRRHTPLRGIEDEGTVAPLVLEPDHGTCRAPILEVVAASQPLPCQGVADNSRICRVEGHGPWHKDLVAPWGSDGHPTAYTPEPAHGVVSDIAEAPAQVVDKQDYGNIVIHS